LKLAYKANPHHYPIRYSLGKALLASGRLNEAEPHVRWCLARRPDDKGLAGAIEAISRQRFAENSAKPTTGTAAFATQSQLPPQSPKPPSTDDTTFSR
jgi:predicted Zn-dependent protease